MTKNGKHRHQPQREQVEAAFLRDAGVQRRQPVAEARLHPAAEQQREARKASVAPIVEAKETITVPQTRPKIAPIARVITAAPGSDSAVTAT